MLIVDSSRLHGVGGCHSPCGNRQAFLKKVLTLIREIITRILI